MAQFIQGKVSVTVTEDRSIECKACSTTVLENEFFVTDEDLVYHLACEDDALRDPTLLGLNTEIRGWFE